MTLQDIYDFFNDMREIRAYMSISLLREGHVLCLEIQNAYSSTNFTREKSKRILEALIKHNGEFDVEIHIIDVKGEHSFPPIKGKGEPFLNPRGFQKTLDKFFSTD